jgi:hypothetical protein
VPHAGGTRLKHCEGGAVGDGLAQRLAGSHAALLGLIGRLGDAQAALVGERDCLTLENRALHQLAGEGEPGDEETGSRHGYPRRRAGE